MKLRRGLPLLLFLAPSLGGAKSLEKRDADGKEVLTNDEILALNRAPAPPLEATGSKKEIPVDAKSNNVKAAQSSRPLGVGTQDAPVDGLDGKPHAGPFVDSTPDEKKGSVKAPGTASTTALRAKPTSLDRYESEFGELPEKNDGVMNDESRPLPKKGTSGTEGGVSEREKERKLSGQVETKPKSPEEAPPLPHEEQDRVDATEEKTGSSSTDATKDDEKVPLPKKVGGEYGAGGYGMEKPTDLPEKPHNIPHPEPNTPTKPDSKSEGGPPVGSSRDKWLQETLPYTEGEKPKKTTSSGGGSVVAPEDEGWHEWFHSFVLSFAMIIFSEIGDKTFLVAALMAMRHDRILVFSAAFGALIVMTVLSAVLGHAVPTLLPKRFTTFAAALLFLVFGAKMLREGLNMPKEAGVGEEMKEVEAELEEKEHTMARRASRRSSVSPYVLESGKGKMSPPSSRSPSPSRRRQDRTGGLMNLLSLVLSPAWMQTFVMTFLGEWGDRSQIATIAMAAGQDYWLVTLGAIVGHACCTGMAVIGGRALAGKVSMRVVTIGGALAFLVFGVIYLWECLTEA